MALNLDSLKNLSQTSISTSTPEKDTVVSYSAPETKVETASIVPEKIPSTGPRISLMKLKQSATTHQEVAPQQAETTPISDTLSVAEIEKGFISHVTKEEEVVIENIAPETSSASDEVTETPVTSHEVIATSEIITSEAQSLVIDTDNIVGEDVEVVDETPKELFPNLQISHTMSLDEDLLDLRSVISTHGSEEIAQDTPNISGDTLVENEVVPVQSDISIITQEANTEAIIAQGTNESDTTELITQTDEFVAKVEVTPEYVAGVKTELSEGRRAGFRFFVKNKTKIMAGVGIVFSLTLVALFSGSFIATDIQKTGKTNVQEEIKNTEATNVVDTVSEVVPVFVPTDYEMGRDYSVTKNTKKNVSSKSASGTSIITSTGTLTP